MYNDSAAINDLTQRIIREMGWMELDSRRVTEQYIQNLVRSTLRPSDIDDMKTKNSIVTQVTASIRRLKPIVG